MRAVSGSSCRQAKGSYVYVRGLNTWVPTLRTVISREYREDCKGTGIRMRKKKRGSTFTSSYLPHLPGTTEGIHEQPILNVPYREPRFLVPVLLLANKLSRRFELGSDITLTYP